jgi:predicted DNA-binding transcriptional regulator YafY
MKPAEIKAERLLQIEALLLDHPEGMTQSEIARRMKVNRSTILRNLDSMQALIYEGDGKVFIDRQAYLINIRFNLHEALSIHLASRLLATVLDRQNTHAASALRKLGLALERLAPHISRHLALSADAIDETVQWEAPNYLHVLEILTLGWAEGRKVSIWHRKNENGPLMQYTFSTYYIEPGAVGRSTYAIGWREPTGELRTFKIERIEWAEITNESYVIPEDFNPQHLFSDAWGIWYTGSEPVEVVLEFNSRVASRLGETRWHRSEKVERLENGKLIWRAKVAEPKEMLYWIRGWGSDCKVLAPESLREICREEAQKIMQNYEQLS